MGLNLVFGDNNWLNPKAWSMQDSQIVAPPLEPLPLLVFFL